MKEKKPKRGAPKGKYIVLRDTLDKMYLSDMKLHEKMKLDEHCKWVLTEHVKRRARETDVI